MAPMTVASRPGVTTAPQPASSRRATTSSTWSGVAVAPMTIRSSGAPVTAIVPSLGTIIRHGRDRGQATDEAQGLLRDPADREEDARELLGRLPAVRADAGGRRGVLLHRRPALDHRRPRPRGAAALDARSGGDAVRCGPRRGALDGFLPVACDCARGGRVAAERRR